MDEVDAEHGLMVLIYGGLLMIFTMMLGVILTSRAKLSEFFAELATQESQPASSLGKEENKAE